MESIHHENEHGFRMVDCHRISNIIYCRRKYSRTLARLQHARLLVDKTGAIKSPEVRAQAVAVLEEFESTITPKLSKLRRSWIHGDLNDRVRCVVSMFAVLLFITLHISV